MLTSCKQVWHNNPSNIDGDRDDAGADKFVFDYTSVACCAIGGVLPATYGEILDPTCKYANMCLFRHPSY